MVDSRQAVMPHLPKLYSFEQIENWIREEVMARQQVWLAEYECEPAGFIAFAGEELNHLYVAPKFWAKGIGSRLLTLAQRQSPRLRLYTFQCNSLARAFYERRGFRLITTSDGSANEEHEPDAQYEWTSGQASAEAN